MLITRGERRVGGRDLRDACCQGDEDARDWPVGDWALQGPSENSICFIAAKLDGEQTGWTVRDTWSTSCVLQSSQIQMNSLTAVEGNFKDKTSQGNYWTRVGPTIRGGKKGIHSNWMEDVFIRGWCLGFLFCVCIFRIGKTEKF